MRANLPPMPQMATPPPVNLPRSFCSACERNRFHDQVYRPARKVAEGNNEAAVAYQKALKTQYDSLNEAESFDEMSAVVDAAQAYEPVSQQAFQVLLQYDEVFDQLMALPIVTCEADGN